MANAGMKMTVIFPNGEIGTIPKYKLEDSIRTKKIIAFLRSSGWVQIDRDPIRKAQRPLTSPGRRAGDSSLNQSPSDTPNLRDSQSPVPATSNTRKE